MRAHYIGTQGTEGQFGGWVASEGVQAQPHAARWPSVELWPKGADQNTTSPTHWGCSGTLPDADDAKLVAKMDSVNNQPGTIYWNYDAALVTWQSTLDDLDLEVDLRQADLP